MTKTKDDFTIQELRNLESLDKRTHETIEGIVKRIQPKIYDPVVYEEIEEFVPNGWFPLD